MEQLEQTGTKAQGNTKPEPKKIRRVCLTLNNYSNEEYDNLIAYVNAGTKIQYIFGKEKGENNTPHIQGYMEFPNPISFSKLKELSPRAHWAKAKGSKAQNYIYCSKDNDFISNIDNPNAFEKAIAMCLDEYKDTKWRPWQEAILMLLDTVPDKRSIHWFFDKNGNTGKSYLCKYIDLKYDAIICEGKSVDIFNQIKSYMDSGKIPKIIILDIPRSSLGYTNYTAIEKIKNGHIYSGKYEGGKCIFPSPHVICFANEEPKYTELSQDRWKVTDVGIAPLVPLNQL